MYKTPGAKRWGAALKAARRSPSPSLAGVASSAMHSRSRSKQRPSSRARRAATGARAMSHMRSVSRRARSASGRAATGAISRTRSVSRRARSASGRAVTGAISRARSVSRRARSASGRAATNLRNTTRAIQSTSVGRTLQRGQELAMSPMHAHDRYKTAVRRQNLGFSSYDELFKAPSQQHVSYAHAARAQPAHVQQQQYSHSYAMHNHLASMPYTQPPQQQHMGYNHHHPQAEMLMMPPPQIPPQVTMCAQLLRQAGFLRQ
jgi:hypothetical protein